MYNYYLTRKNISSIIISTLTCKFSNAAVINHVMVYIVQTECHEIISTAILSLPLSQVGQLSVAGEIDSTG